jgi:hypothetical protein
MTPVERIASRIVVVRGLRVMLDSDLAALYGVTVRRLNEQVGRNAGRFPLEFCFRLSAQELAILKSQNATSSWGGKRKLPIAFTEHGALMAATVLTSSKATRLSVFVIRAFVQMREALTTRQEIGKRLDELESKVGTHDRAIAQIFNALRQLTTPPDPPSRRRIGFL